MLLVPCRFSQMLGIDQLSRFFSAAAVAVAVAVVVVVVVVLVVAVAAAAAAVEAMILMTELKLPPKQS